MAKKTRTAPITEMPPTAVEDPPKHHEMQAIKNITYVRKAVQFLMAASLRNIRQKLSMIPGNEFFVERLRGRTGDEILANCTTFVLQEIGDSSTSLETGTMRAVARSVRGEMGLAASDFDQDDEEADEQQAETA